MNRKEKKISGLWHISTFKNQRNEEYGKDVSRIIKGKLSICGVLEIKLRLCLKKRVIICASASDRSSKMRSEK